MKIFPKIISIYQLSFFSFPKVMAMLALRLTPEQDGDMLPYHMTPPKNLIEQGRIIKFSRSYIA